MVCATLARRKGHGKKVLLPDLILRVNANLLSKEFGYGGHYHLDPKCPLHPSVEKDILRRVMHVFAVAACNCVDDRTSLCGRCDSEMPM